MAVTTTQNLDLFADHPVQLSPNVAAALEILATQGGEEARGAVYTRTEVAEFILDLVGYTEDKPLYLHRFLEPSFGAGDFLIPAINRLLRTWKISKTEKHVIKTLKNAICAVELHRETYLATSKSVISILKQKGVCEQDAVLLANHWLVQGDFLLAPLMGTFDFVVGNPPYVRQELIPAPLLSEYRARFHTIYDRADLYIPFIERSLNSLSADGKLGLICADRWMKNRYGGPLRKLVAEEFNLDIYIDMVDTPAFHGDVSAYPAITVIGRERRRVTRVAHRPEINRESLRSLITDFRSDRPLVKNGVVREVADIVNSDEPWVLDTSDQRLLIRQLEDRFPNIEEADCKVGIGVATGADDAFIGDFESLDVEKDRKLPLVTTRDIQSGKVEWRGLGVINPFTDEGPLVRLEEYPRLARYFKDRKSIIAKRHCAIKIPLNWYRTIDRITPSLLQKPKLLIPDIKGDANIVFESGKYYPHHNLYYITSESWNLLALQAVLLSGIARLFVANYSTKMRGGYLRYQAQYLRRIRIPLWAEVPEALRRKLIKAAETHDIAKCNDAVSNLYGLKIGELVAALNARS